MMLQRILKQSLFFLLLFLGCSIFFLSRSFAEDPTLTPTPTTGDNKSQQAQDLQNKISDLENKLSNARTQDKTLSSQISVMDSQINLTELRINSTKRDVLELITDIDTTKEKIATLEGSLTNLTKVLLNRIVATYEVGTIPSLSILVSSNTISDFIKRENYLRIAQAHDKRLIYDTVQAKNDYSNQKEIFEEKKKKIELLKSQLESYTQQLSNEQESKKTLLAETQGNEANYQRLLAEAKAQLAGFSNFTANSGGSSLLSGQTVCNDWGCYYNQRDSQWGGNSLNGTQYSIASDGCLVTSMAMVMTHYGHKTTPSDINNNSGNFASYYPAYLKYTISANGVTAARVGAIIDSTLNNENHDPVIVGVRAYGGTHFVVLKSGANGSYMMYDPYLEGGHDISFTEHYSMGSIFEVDKVVFL